jgi:glycosyltransferase involved in cell wall biosynthesis
VSLVIKTFPNIHNTVAGQIEAIRSVNPDCPDIVLLDADLPDGAIRTLYESCHALVAPTRGEGFGLPLAEAMLFGLPVITTAGGGQTDFCSPETAWLIDFQWAPARTHMALPDSVWMEPDADHLGRLLREVHHSPPELLGPRTRRARQRILEQWTWARSVERVHAAVRDLTSRQPLARRKLRLAWVSSWSAKCGISAYSSYFVSHLPPEEFSVTILAPRAAAPLVPDAANVLRCWDDRTVPHLQDLARELKGGGYDAVVIQFNFAYFDLEALGNLIAELHHRRIAVVVIFHATAEVRLPDRYQSLRSIKDRLALADRLIVHGPDDLNRLREYGLTANVTLFPHGVIHRPVKNTLELRRHLGLEGGPILATYGFLLPHKGIPELIRAFPRILQAHPAARLLLVNAIYPDPQSVCLRDHCRELIQELGLARQAFLLDEFLADEETLTLLESADLVLFPYQQTSESSSAAVRAGLASNRPVACTPLSIFRNVAEVCHTLPGISPDDLADGILSLLAAPERLAARQEAQQRWLVAHSWQVLGERLGGMLRGLVGEHARATRSGRGSPGIMDLSRVA